MIVIEENGARPSHRGDGIKESEICYTLTQVDRHAVCYDVVLLKHHIPLVTEIAKDQNNIQTLIARAGTGGVMFP